ncbi:MAG: hypothetical protein SVY15_08510 [Halobacteriota archaeon]|nr:hypothetical protein [Halobacteriota archaeon]
MDKKEMNEILTLITFVMIILVTLWLADLPYNYAFFIAIVTFVIGLLRINQIRSS